MKSFYTACAILLVILVSVTFISLNVSKELAEFRDDILSLPDSHTDETLYSKQALKQLLYKWEEMKTLLALTVPHTEIMRVEPELYNINVYYHSKVSHEYKAARERLLCAVQALLDAERLWWENIL